MRKILFAAFASMMLLALALPAGALAHHRSARHALRRHHKHAAIRILDFHAAAAPSAPSTPPSSPPTTTPPAPEQVGTVASFTGGVLTIKLNDNSTVSGKVTEETEIHCTTANTPNGDDDQGSGDENQGGGPSPQGDASTRAHESWAHAGDGQAGEQSNGSDSDSQDDNGQSSCPANPLAEGAPVLYAELMIGPSGAVWKHVDLLK